MGYLRRHWPLLLLASVYEKPSAWPVFRPNSPQRLGPVLCLPPSSTEWHWEHFWTKAFFPFSMSPIVTWRNGQKQVRHKKWLFITHNRRSANEEETSARTSHTLHGGGKKMRTSRGNNNNKNNNRVQLHEAVFLFIDQLRQKLLACLAPYCDGRLRWNLDFNRAFMTL